MDGYNTSNIFTGLSLFSNVEMTQKTPGMRSNRKMTNLIKKNLNLQVYANF